MSTRPGRLWGVGLGPGDPELVGDLADPADATSLDLAGDNDCVLATSSVHGVDHRCWRGPVARYAFDLADPAARPAPHPSSLLPHVDRIVVYHSHLTPHLDTV